MSKIKTWWLSLCDPDRPKGYQFLGVIIVDGISEMDAHWNINLLNINPGGEIRFLDITKISDRVKPAYKNRLLNRKEADEAIEGETVVKDIAV